MLIAIIAIIALFALLGVGRLLLTGVVPRYSGLSPDDIGRYTRHLAKALDDGGRVEIDAGVLPGPIVVQRRRSGGPQGSEDLLVLRLRKGAFNRGQLQAAAQDLSSTGTRFGIQRGVLGRLQEISIPFAAGSPATAGAVSELITRFVSLSASGKTSDSPQPRPKGTFSIICRGPFRPPHGPEDGQVINSPLSRRLGFALGRAASAFFYHSRTPR